MHGDAFMQLSVVIVIAAAVSLIMRMLRQPLIIGYIITGILVGPSLLGAISDHTSFNVFSDIGIALLLFIVGLELNTAVIRQLGKAVLVTASGLLAVMVSLGFGAATLLGFNTTESLLVGLALFFSSTIIIAKVLSDKREMSRLHGQIAIGIILLDDVVATLALLFVAAGNGGSMGVGEISGLALKGGGLLVVFSLISAYILPRLTKFMASSQELLFLFSLAWGFGVATLVHKAGFSIEIGALFAGVMLAHLTYVAEIGARLKQLRNFFVVLFFVVLGEGLSISHLGSAVVPALVFSAIVIVAKPIAVMTSLGVLGYTKRTGFKAAINLSQISEFSIILVVLAHSSGLVGSQLAAVITLVALITIATSTYLMQYDNALYAKLERLLTIFERKDTKERESRHKTYPLILFGYKKGGHEFVKTFRAMEKSFMVVDYNPDVIELLDRQQIPCLYGDATDVELLNELHIHTAKLAVSTITDFNTNQILVRYIAQHNQDAVIICHADDHNQAAELYGLGATYVMLPHYIGSERMSQFIHRRGLDKKDFEQYRERHLLAIGKIGIGLP
ncbi:MAG TPA: cation:proton antiporter [Candidatus Saccharimonadales bacterium]|nr:cation:proton antiporter [Candidatus Saccharimonadales bacterium]